MLRERWLRVKGILASVLELPEPERAAAVDAACRGDAELRAEVASLLAGERTPLLLDLASMSSLDSAEVRSVAPGTRLGPYEVAELIGAGGMGEVYRGRDTRLGREVAVKVVGTARVDQQRRLEQEARAASTLNHPNILTLFDVGFEGDIQYVVTELLQGRTLRSQLAEGPPDLATALHWISQIAAGLEAAHASGVIHRDLKPENLFVTKSGLVKILDFGLAKQVEPAAAERSGEGPSGLTAPGALLGTLGYMAPEQLRGFAADARSDVFSFGAVAYELLTGRRAFRGESPADTLGAILCDSLPRASTLRAGVPPAVDELLERCLAKDPAERPGSGAELRQAVAALSSESASGGPRLSGRAGRWPVLAGLGIAVLAAAFAYRSFVLSSGPLAIGSAGRPAVAVFAFEDHTGDPSHAWLSKGLPSMLVTGLAQTRGLSVVGTERLQDVLSQMESEPRARPGRAAEAARRSGAGALLVGSLLKASTGLRIDVRLEDVKSGKVLIAESVEGADPLALTDTLVGRIRARLSLEDGAPARPLREVTTTSLAAYQLYVKAVEARNNQRTADAERLLLEAVRLDPSFGLAWAQLAHVGNALGRVREPAEYRKKALANAQRLPERQRLLIEAGDPHDPRADTANAIRLLSTLVDRYPDEEEAYDLLAHFYEPELTPLLPLFERWRRAVPGSAAAHLHNHYGYVLLKHGLLTDAKRELDTYARMRPDEPNAYDSLGEFYLLTGRPQQALEQYQRALSMDPSFGWSLLGSAWAHGMSGSYGEAFRDLDRARELGSGRGFSVGVFYFEAFLKTRVGRFRDAARLIQEEEARAVASGVAHGHPTCQLLLAMIDFERGRIAEGHAAIEAAQRALAASSRPAWWRDSLGAIARLLAGTAAARAGNLEAANAQLAALRGESAAASRLLKWTRHGLAGEIALASGKPAEARASFEAGLPDPRLEVTIGGGMLFVLANSLPARDGIARARAASGDLSGAFDEYSRLVEPRVSSRWPSVLEPRYVLARAVLAERLGRADVAAAERRRFHELWKEADGPLSEGSVARQFFGDAPAR